LETVKTDLEGLAQESSDLHGQCDFTLKNFEIRQSSRMQEIEALKQVKAILSGAKFAAFLQGPEFSDDGSAAVVEADDSQSDVDPLEAYTADAM